MPLPHRPTREVGVWFPWVVFVSTIVAFMPLALFGLRTYLAVDLNQVGFPYDALSPDSITRPTLQTDQVEWLPWLVDFYHEIRQGNFPQWSHHIAGGSPHGVLPFLGTLSPFNAGLLFLPAWYAISLGVAFSLLAGQWGMYLLCRRLGCSVIPSTIAGVAYGFTGTYLVMIHRITAIALVPLVLWAVHRLVEETSTRNIAWLGGLVAWTWFAGFPSGFVYAVYLVALWGVWLIVDAIRDGRFTPRVALGRVGALATAGLLGTALSAITLIPFANEVITRDSLTERVWGSSDHMPTLNLFGILDQVAIGDADSGPWFAGWNPIETGSQVGFIVMGFACAGLLLAAMGRLCLPTGAGSIWTFFCLLAVATTTLVWLGTPLLGLAYQLPGIGSGPIPRLRFLLPLAMVVIGALSIEGTWRWQDTGGQTPHLTHAPRLISGLTFAFFVGVFAWHTPAYWDLMSGAGQRRNVGVGYLVGIGLLVVAGALGYRAIERARWRVPVGMLICALVFGQAWYPYRDLTPQADPDWFYTTTEAHDSVSTLTGGRYRFLAPGVQNFYPNGSQMQEIVDLRGVTIYDPTFKKLVEHASPEAFTRDPFKITSVSSEWDWSSPALDVLAIGVVALPLDEPIGFALDPTPFDGFLPTVELPRQELTAPGPITGLSIPVFHKGECTDERWTVALLTANGTQLDRASGWVVDLPVGDEGTLTTVIDGSGLAFRDRYELQFDFPLNDRCETAVGIQDVADPSVAITPWVGAAESPGPLTLAETNQAAIYTRPSANELVAAFDNWTFAGDPLAGLRSDLPHVTRRNGNERTPPGPGGAAPRVTKYALVEDGVDIVAVADDVALVVVAQQHAYGWEVSIDGTAATVETVHGTLTGVFVEAGTHDIEFRYRPATFAWGWKISAVALCVLIALAVRRTRTDVPSSSADST